VFRRRLLTPAANVLAVPWRPAETLAEIDALLPPGVAERARRVQAESGRRLDLIAAKLGLISDADLALLYATQLGEPVLASANYPAGPVAADRLRTSYFRHTRLLPIAEDDRSCTLAMADPLDDQAARAIEFALEKPVVRRVGLPADIEAAIHRLYSPVAPSVETADADNRPDEARDADLDRLRDLASEAPVIRLVNAMIADAVARRASDIHVEATEAGLRVRLRVDGVLCHADPPAPRLRAAIISRIKIMARLNIAERRLAQDGRIRQVVRGQEIDLRVSTTPALHGESVVLRILDRGALALDFDAIGFDAAILPRWRALVRRPHGVVLVTGPTGSGKTTTLYTTLRELNAAECKILTVEDPVEYVLTGINQIQVKPQIGLTFAAALRSFLRQDPDIMMVGEIRDLETAQIALQAALTGHLVLSTVHTNDAASAVTRLMDMGVEGYLLPPTLAGVLAQRLVRVLCPACKQPYEAPAELLGGERPGLALGAHVTLHRAVGCEACAGTGYRGRTMILELMVMTDRLRTLILNRADTASIHAVAIKEGMQTMHEHGLQKALSGTTTLEEVARVIRD
jgi:general secretion pathway protein E